MRVDELGSQMQQQMSILQWLAARLGGMENTVHALPDNVSLPIETMADLEDLEQLIASSTDARSKVVRSVLPEI